MNNEWDGVNPLIISHTPDYYYAFVLCYHRPFGIFVIVLFAHNPRDDAGMEQDLLLSVA